MLERYLCSHSFDSNSSLTKEPAALGKHCLQRCALDGAH